MVEEIKVKKWHQHWWGIIILIVLACSILYLAGFIFQVVYFIEQNTALKYQAMNTLYNTNSSGTLVVPIETADDPALGSDGAIIKIVEFSDFQCPYCQQAYPDLRKLINEYPTDVKIIYRDYPNIATHPDALNAALAANCAFEQDKFWAYHDLIFNNQSNLSISELKLYASQLKLNTDQFNQCLDDQKYLYEIQDDMQDGMKLSITGTPTFFINGIKVPGIIDYETLKTIIDKVKSLKLP